jgi:hypothetical protein
LAELVQLAERFPPGEVGGRGITCDPAEVVRLKIEGKSHSQIAENMALSKATVAATFRRWYLKARELQADPSRFTEISPTQVLGRSS